MFAACASTGSAEGFSTSVASTTVPPPTSAIVTTTAPPPVCVVAAEPGDWLSIIATRNGLNIAALEAENVISATETIHPGDRFDVCIGNGFDDVTGASRIAPLKDAVVRQQEELNELFAGTSLPPLAVDGDSGKRTRQAACAARMGLGLTAHTGHLVPGSAEEAAIFTATALAVPTGAPTDAAKWILIDQTCQVIFTGEGRERVVDVFPTSTGEAGFGTHNVQARAFRFDPALDNEGWHDSSSFPVDVDNPLNGNMYKPIYFNEGQAIHGAGAVPPQPRSKGCARTLPDHQDKIIEWLGLSDRLEATWNPDDVGVTVVVQGQYRDVVAP